MGTRTQHDLALDTSHTPCLDRYRHCLAATDRPACCLPQPPLTAPPVANATDAANPPARMPLAVLLAGQVLQDGEIVQIIIKPSRWFILLNSLLFCTGVVVIVSLLHVSHWQPLGSLTASIQLSILLIAARLMWSVLQWSGRYYLLTNLRVIRLSGVFDVEINSIPLRKVSSVKLYRTVSERLLNKGSLEIAGQDFPLIFWQTISRPSDHLERVTIAVKKSQQNGC